jgi:glycerol-3-phosphate dehydrogenase
MAQSSTTSSSLHAGRRAAELAALADGRIVDLLVVGLGVTGAGVALDAAARGLSVTAVDAHDIAFGTSRWSSKMVHGGLRYLASGRLGVAWESARERGVMMAHTAPHLTRPLPILLPLNSLVDDRVARGYRAGIRAGDVLRRAAGTPAALLPPPRSVPAARVTELFPGVRADGLRGGYLNWDGQVEDDARLAVALARTAAGLGAHVLTRTRVTALDGAGADVTDGLTGATLRLRARAVVNAAGVWAGQLVPEVRLRPSRGSHLVLRAASLGHPRAAVMVPVPAIRSFIFALPQPGGLVYAGLTDVPVDGPIEDVPTAPESDVAFLLDHLGPALSAPLTRADVVGTYAGLRPLLADDSGRPTRDLSRRHAVLRSPSGVVTVVGGKLTTYRAMAADAVDAAVRGAGLPAGPSTTRRCPLVGAAARDELARLDAPTRLVRRYGIEAPAVATLSTLDPSLAEPVVDGAPYTGAEVVWALRHEGALDADDILDRRTRIGLVPADRERARPRVEDLVAAHAVR